MDNQGFTSTMDIPVNLPSLPEEYPDYSSADYWDQRYSRKIQLTLKEQGNVDIYEDWYLQYEQLKPEERGPTRLPKHSSRIMIRKPETNQVKELPR